jgi:uncharacterized protein YbaR (Trm112 family)
MRYWGMDFIRCPHCKNYPLKLIPLETVEEDVDTSGLEFPLCRNYCAYLDKPIRKGEKYPCDKCLRIGIKTGVIYCPKCGRWYPIRNGIVYLLRDNKRRKESDLEFLKKWKDKLPKEIVYKGKPYNLSEVEEQKSQQ